MFQLIRYKSDSRPPNHQQQRSNELSLGAPKLRRRLRLLLQSAFPSRLLPPLLIPLGSGKCCPNSGDNGQCCDDGTCVTSTQICCLYGGACDNGRDCCVYGCKPKGNSCCSDGTTCYPGYFCCSNGNCATNGGECCDNGGTCGNGLHCVLYDGKPSCCKDLSCSEYASGAIGGGATPVSIPSVTTSSFTSGPLPSHSASSISGTSLPPATTEDVTFEYYYTTWTWRYYYYFLTSTTVTTSTYTTTSTVVSVYASASSAAELTFARLSAETTFPTATTAAEVTAAPNPTVQSLNSASTASAVGGATQQRGSVSWGVSNIAACAVAIGIGMVWL